MTANLALWNTVEKTDPKHVKAITGKSYQGNSPKPHYLIHKATETFGPCGIGWGFTIADERVEEGAGGERMHFARVRVWFKWNGERGEVEHVGGTQFCGTRASGKPFTDEDAPKKSVTDALVKALSMIGFAGDIFMGRYDDSKYVAEVREEFAPEAANAPATKSSAQLKRENAFEEFERELDECKTLVALDKFKKFWGPKTVADGWTAAWKSAARDRIEGREKAIMDEVDRLSNASDEELAGMPVRDTLNASLNTLAGG